MVELVDAGAQWESRGWFRTRAEAGLRSSLACCLVFSGEVVMVGRGSRLVSKEHLVGPDKMTWLAEGQRDPLSTAPLRWAR